MPQREGGPGRGKRTPSCGEHAEGTIASVLESQAIIAQGLLFIAGQVPIDPQTGSVPESFADQVHQTLRNLAAVAEAAGGSLADAARVNVYLEDIDRVQEMDAIYRGYFVEPLPADDDPRRPARGFLVEMDAIVALGLLAVAHSGSVSRWIVRRHRGCVGAKQVRAAGQHRNGGLGCESLGV